MFKLTPMETSIADVETRLEVTDGPILHLPLESN